MGENVSASAPFPATGALDLPDLNCAARSMRLYNLEGLDEGRIAGVGRRSVQV